ncbi:unnamed protein product [Prorocentrum cordatum]|uniref:UDP-N-acetylglucosamine transferase subunit ALG14 n=1 Tax=Prorocentrum cordatum TaxID=2364126 RepID=A0ABN9W1I8_9DINO|nr:unnamed protein product [Polarella glacialis]
MPLVVWVLALLLLLLLRLACWARRRISTARRPPQRLWQGHPLPLRALAVLGSGGHTTEMLGLLAGFDQGRYHFQFVLADTDTTSLKKVGAARPDLVEDTSRFHAVTRSREVGQSWSSSAVSTARAFLECLTIVWAIRPQVLLVNGPGTCVPVVAAALFFELVFGRPVVLIFTESFCRVKSLSLTGRMLYALADVFVVHWPALVERYPKAQYCGVLM